MSRDRVPLSEQAKPLTWGNAMQSCREAFIEDPASGHVNPPGVTEQMGRDLAAKMAWSFSQPIPEHEILTGLAIYRRECQRPGHAVAIVSISGQGIPDDEGRTSGCTDVRTAIPEGTSVIFYLTAAAHLLNLALNLVRPEYARRGQPDPEFLIDAINGIDNHVMDLTTPRSMRKQRDRKED